jgi:hypothetical protein
MSIVGYTLNGQDNDTHMFDQRSGISRCPTCGYRLDFAASNPAYRLRRMTLDISSTYDNQTIVSRAFKEICDQLAFPGVEFIAFKDEPMYFHLMPTRRVTFDSERRRTRFIKLCDQCGNFESVIGATPALLKVTVPLSTGFFGTDILFGSGDEKSPLDIVSIDTRLALEATDLKGLEFGPVYGLGE